MKKKIRERAKKIKLILMDCDGVLTDGKLYYGENGESLKVFHVRDGQGIVNWHKAGYQSGIISGRGSKILESRATELGISYIRQSSSDKVSDFQALLQETKLKKEEVAFIGDDVADIPLLNLVGLSFTVADAAKEVFGEVDVVLKTLGGNGAVREMIDMLLKED